jgi:hypothetical protein
MRQQHFAVFATIVGTAIGACGPGTAPPISSPIPVTPGTPTSDPSTLRFLLLVPGTYHYQLTQTAEIEGDGTTDTIPSTTVTRAIVQAVVTSQPDSIFTVIVSFDSITITAQGSIPTRGVAQQTSLDSVAQGIFSRAGNSFEVRLPDSLCSYSQFTSIARELLLPELDLASSNSGRRVYTDTTSYRTCRAGTSIDITVIRELRETGRDPSEMEIQQHAELHGTGLLRRDSITISGSVTTRGKASFTGTNRLPALVQTRSDGTIMVRLGSVQTQFRQRSTQELRLITAEPN